MNLTDMDLVRGAIANAELEGMTLAELFAAAEYAETCEAFEQAVNELAQTMPVAVGQVDNPDEPSLSFWVFPATFAGIVAAKFMVGFLS